jgi:hypothetical protein
VALTRAVLRVDAKRKIKMRGKKKPLRRKDMQNNTIKD